MTINKRYSFLFFILLMVCLIFVHGTDAVSVEHDKVSDSSISWKEIRLTIDSHDSAWCGNRSIVFSGYGKDKGKGIRLFDLDSGVIQDVTNDPAHRNVSCAADGRYIIFTGDIFIKDKQGCLFVYDRNTKTVKKMYEIDSLLLKKIHKAPLSPNANYLIYPDLSRSQQYILPGGKEVKLLPYKINMNYIRQFTKLQWSADESKLYLYDRRSGRLDIHDLEKGNDRDFYLECNLRELRITENKILYADQMFSSDMGDDGVTNLYVYEFPYQSKPRKLLVKGIEFYHADDEGNIVFSKELKNGRGIYYLKRGRTKAQILKEIPVPNSIGIWPRITNDGKGIIFSVPTTPRGTRVYTILVRN